MTNENYSALKRYPVEWLREWAKKESRRTGVILVAKTREELASFLVYCRGQ